MRIDEFDYNLPESLIAQRPSEKRDVCRLMVLDMEEKSVDHKHFYDILNYLGEGDCLVLNNSKVLPARLFGEKVGTGAKVEFLLIKRLEGDKWETMVRPGRRLKPGDSVAFGENLNTCNRSFFCGCTFISGFGCTIITFCADQKISLATRVTVITNRVSCLYN